MNRFDEYDEMKDYDLNSETDEKISSTNSKKKFSAGSQTLIIIQLILCGLILICAVALKSFGGSLYAAVGTWFYDNYNNSIFTGTKDNVISFVDHTKTTEKDNIALTESNSENTNIAEKIKSNIKKPLASGTVTSGFGNRDDRSESEFHKGIDIAADKGSEIYAVLDGTVIISKKDDSYGNYIVIEHSDNVKTLYAHCSKLCVKQGEKVKAGQKIALVGSTGDSDGNHLHLEIIVDGKNIDPQTVFGKEYM